MSTNLSTAFIAQFDAMVKHAYQASGILRPSVRLKTGVKGSTHRFPTMGKGVATQRVPQTDVVPMNISHDNKTATLSDWNAPEYTDIFDQAKVNFDEQKELATTIASAMTRREDQLILDALDAASSTLTVGTDIGGSGTDMNTSKVRRAKRLLDDQEVPSEDRCIVVSSQGLESMLGDTQATSSDFNTVKALVNGEVDSFVGFKWKTMGTRSEGGLPKASNVRTSYAYHKWAIGLAVGIDHRTEVNYIPEKTSWLANGIFSAGSVGIDALGIVEISTTEAS